MRLEIALIVGILFFCSWCAYIVARMNSSVNVGTLAGAPVGGPTHSSLSPFASTGSQGQQLTPGGVGGGDLASTTNGGSGVGVSGPLSGHASTRAEHQSPRLVGASEPIASAQFTASAGQYEAGRNWQPPPPPPYVSGGSVDTAASNYPTHAADASGTQPAHGLQQWHSYALPSHVSGASQPLLLDFDSSGQQRPAATGENDTGAVGAEGEEPEEEGGVADYPQTGAASGEEQPEGEEDVEEEEEENQQPPPPQTELEEIANRRSFDELQSDSSERDKDGHVVVTKRRHLINGRPVAAEPSQAVDGDEVDEGQGEGQEDEEERNTAASSRVPFESAPGQSEADFEELVNEIDQEDKLRKKVAGAAKPEVVVKRTGISSAQSRQRATKLVPAGEAIPDLMGRRSDTDTPTEKTQGVGSLPGSVRARYKTASSSVGQQEDSKDSNKDKDSHEHSLQESLQAQQWDDDSATSGGAGISPEEAPEIGDDEDQEEVSNIVERDQEARRLAQMSRDLLQSPERVSRELDQEQERRRRRRRRRKRETRIISSVPLSTTLSLHNSVGTLAAAPSPAPEAKGANEISPARDLSREERPEVDNATTRMERQVRFSAPTASARQVGGRLRAATIEQEQALMGAETNRERAVLSAAAPARANHRANDNDTANHPTSMTGTNHLLSVVMKDVGNQTRENSNTSEPQMSRLEDMRVEVLAHPAAPVINGAPPTGVTLSGTPLLGHAHQGGGPQVASGSHKVRKKAKSVTKTGGRKKKYKKAGKSKMVDSKYKAARAYARKHASRHKNGQMRKKRRKSEKNLAAQKQHFKGATRGNKFARGERAHGANKGAKFYKDKGYKKRGFKKAYHKLETGDHKTYFDEFRDKDHHKKWKNFDNRHKYSQKKKWAGSDSKNHEENKLKLARARAFKAGKWRESAANRHVNEMDKYKKYKKSGSKSKVVKSGKKKKKRKKTKTKKKKIEE